MLRHNQIWKESLSGVFVDGEPGSRSIYMSPQEIAAWPVGAPRAEDADPKTPLKAAIKRHGLDHPLQTAGRHFAMGCVALEITQRCNLDCTLCYLSDQSEAVRDLPLVEVLRRIDRVRDDYGPHTNIQITGGDPTLRKRDELIAIVAHAARRELKPSLFTNGIKATRSLLTDLATAGLKDVAFHVDMTQERRGYANEAELNALRLDYIARAKNLGLHIIFNTTVFDGNIGEIPALAAFFKAHAYDVRMASFQLQAATGRGVLGETEGAVTQGNVARLVRQGAGEDLRFDWPEVGHKACNRYGSLLVSGGEAAPLFDAPRLFADLFEAAETVRLDRHNPLRTALSVASLALRRPGLVARTAGFGARKAWALRRGLVRSRGQVKKLTYYIHNFMDAAALERDRCEACVFMTMTRDGPVSMCVHNAKRDAYILQPVKDAQGVPWRPIVKRAEELPVKKLKGRLRKEKTKAAS